MDVWFKLGSLSKMRLNNAIFSRGRGSVTFSFFNPIIYVYNGFSNLFLGRALPLYTAMFVCTSVRMSVSAD